jgi:toxin ParE1/3/4
MAALVISRSAKADLLSIGAYTLERWGRVQAERYLDDLELCLELLAANPLLGRECEWIRPGLCRFEKGRHVVFYGRKSVGIHVSRILHQSMLPEGEHFDDPAEFE